jgi:hypothetical protein
MPLFAPVINAMVITKLLFELLDVSKIAFVLAGKK